jgi:uncharacterized membrane protein
MKRLTRYFAEGLFFVVPIALTLYVVYAIFHKIDGLFSFPIPGAGFLLTIAVITFTGFIASNFLARWAVVFVDNIFSRLPLVKMLYTSIKDLVGAFVGDKRSFTKPVTVALSEDGAITAIGFVTAESLAHIGMEGRVAVYMPQSYNFAGNMIVVPADRVAPIDAPAGDVMAFVVSGGVARKHT